MSTLAQLSVTNAFDTSFANHTTVAFSGSTVYYTKLTFTDLATITAPTTVTTMIVGSMQDNSRPTRSLKTVIIGPGGVW